MSLMGHIGRIGPIGPMILTLIWGCAGGRGLRPAQLDEPPEVVISAALQELRDQRSVRYRWEFGVRGEMQGDMEGSFEGWLVQVDRARVEGLWRFAGQDEKVRLRAHGDRQFRWDHTLGSWVVEPRTDESRPLAELDRILGLGGFELVGRDRWEGRECLVYSFQPNLVHLDPSMEKSLVGQIWIDEADRLPLRVWASDEESTLHWSLRFSDFGSAVEIEPPLVDRYVATLQVVQPGDFSPAHELLAVRLRSCGVSLKEIQQRGEGEWEVVVAAEEDPEDLLSMMVERGEVEIWLAEWPARAELAEEDLVSRYGPAAKVVLERGRIGRPLVLTELMAGSEDLIGAQLVRREMGERVVEFALRDDAAIRLSDRTAGHTGRPLAVVLDGKVVSTVVVREPLAHHVTTGEELTLEECCALVAIVRSGPLPVGFRLIDLNKGE
jgi:hypothetical protein